MIFNKDVDIDFGKFYLIEFFKNSLQSGQGSISDDNLNLLDELSAYLVRENNVIEGFEKLARYQGTNEFSIFLFDMLDHLHDYQPQDAYDRIPDLANDFVNLYNLMLEEKECVDAIHDVLKQYRNLSADEEPLPTKAAEAVPAEEEKVAEKELPKEEIITSYEDGIGFFDFYYKEFSDLLYEKIKTENDETDAARYRDLFQAFVRFNREIDPSKRGDYRNSIEQLAGLIDKVFPENKKRLSTVKLMKGLEKQVKKFIGQAKRFDRYNKKAFQAIIENNEFTKKRSRKATEKKKEPEVSTIETILFDYFKSEVYHRIDEIEDTISNLQDQQRISETDIENLTANFKNLKEVSMIHGYNGMEHLAAVIIKMLTKLNKTNIDFTEESFDTIREIIEKLKNVSEFQNIDKDDKLMRDMENKIYSIENTVSEYTHEADEEDEDMEDEEEQEEVLEDQKEKSGPELTAEAAEPEKEEDKEAQPEPEEESIAFTDKQRLLQIAADTLQELCTVVEKFHKNLTDDSSQKQLNQLVTRLQKQMTLIDDALNVHFFSPLQSLYQKCFETRAASDDLSDKLNQIWKKAAQVVINPEQWAELKPDFDNAFGLLEAPDSTEEEFSLQADEKISVVLHDSLRARWQNHQDTMNDVFIKGMHEKEADLRTFFTFFKDTLSLSGYVNFIPFTTLFLDLINDHGDITFDEEIVTELNHSLKLVFERIRHKGRDGDCDDITAALEELIADVRKAAGKSEVSEKIQKTDEPEVEPVQEEAEEEKAAPESADEEDVTAIFYSEVQDHLEKINQALEKLDSDGNDRTQYNIIETAVHDIRSSAHLLNLTNVVKISALIEEIAEIYGQSDIRIPDDLSTNVRSGVEDLKIAISDPNAEIDKAIESLQYVVDHIVIEDSQPVPPQPDVTKQPEEKEKPAVEEQPLFLETEDVDQEFLNIFREEAGNYLKIIEDANHKMIQNLDDMESLTSFENAAHSLKSSAKMIGFKEIGQLTDAMEQISESIKSKELKNTIEIQENIASAVDLIKRLSRGDQVNSNELVTVLNNLSPGYFSKEILEEFDEEEPSDLQADAGMKDVFLLEGAEIMQALNEDLLELEQAPASETVLNDILRRLHTLKGSAALFNYNKIKDLSHKLEDYFQIYTDKNLEQKEEMLNPAFSAIDLIGELLTSIKEGHGEHVEQFTPRMAEIDNRLFLFRNFGVKTAAEVDTPKPEPQKPTTTRKKSKEDDTIIRVQTDYLDRLIDMAADLMINQTQLNTNLDMLQDITGNIESEKKRIQSIISEVEEVLEENEGVSKPEEMNLLGENLKGFSDILHQVATQLSHLNQDIEYSSGRISNLSKLLHNDILKTRMIPVEKLFNRYPRAVRDMAKEQGKRINLSIEGGDTEMDRAMIEALNDPVLHIIRNAIDHGLEKPAERTESKKDKTGKLLLKARHDRNQVVIEIEDDGRGIDLDRVRKKIIEKNLATAAQVEQMSEAETLDYLFHSGFTTRDEATEVSGRGIGLDVVKLQIQKLKGNIRIRTEPEQGTTLSIRVPLTLLISQALLVEVGGQKIAIPLTAVQETMYFGNDEIEEDGGKKFLLVRGNYLPFINLDELLDFKNGDQDQTEEKMAVIVHDAGVSVAMGVSRIMERQEIVIKSLGSHLQNVEYISGGTILGSGEVALILDYATVIRTVEVQFFGSVRDRYAARKAAVPVRKKSQKKTSRKTPTKISSKEMGKKVVKERKPRILIVDDSISVRNFVGSILERNKYETVKSSNGADAWEQLQKGEVDLMITDLEMPEMHGFELISKIREKNDFDDLPIIILTGRAGMKHRQKGESLGANSFLVKPFKENDLLRSISDFVEREQ